MVYTEKRVETMLRRRGYKITPQRRAILNAAINSREHLTPAAIHEKVTREYPGIGLVTIYRTLDILAELGLICEMHTGGNSRTYLMRRPTEHHHHLICSECGTVIDFTDCDLEALQRRLSSENSFRIDSHLLEFIGQCSKCCRGKETVNR
jgi:Fur family ferric uptake transcriptional regulator